MHPATIEVHFFVPGEFVLFLAKTADQFFSKPFFFWRSGRLQNHETKKSTALKKVTIFSKFDPRFLPNQTTQPKKNALGY